MSDIYTDCSICGDPAEPNLDVCSAHIESLETVALDDPREKLINQFEQDLRSASSRGFSHGRPRRLHARKKTPVSSDEVTGLTTNLGGIEMEDIEKYLSGGVCSDDTGGDPNQQSPTQKLRNPPDCPWCFGRCDDAELCSCNGGKTNIADCPSAFCDYRRSFYREAAEEAIYRSFELYARRAELRIDDERGRQVYIQANIGFAIDWILRLIEIENKIDAESLKRGRSK